MTNWYVVRTAPGSSRQAPPRAHLPIERQTESIAERAVRDAGLIAYTPSMRKDIIHHRTKKLITRKFPLMAGYMFAGFPTLPNFMRLATLREIQSILGADGHPWQIPSREIERFQQAEIDMAFDDTREARIHRQEIGRTARLTMQMQYPAGTSIALNGGPFTGFCGRVTSVTGRNTVKAMVEIFSQLVEIEIPIDFCEKVA